VAGSCERGDEPSGTVAGGACSLDRQLLKVTTQAYLFLTKLIVAELVRKVPAFYGTQRFIPMFIRARFCS
jgi:hypothetical protein